MNLVSYYVRGTLAGGGGGQPPLCFVHIPRTAGRSIAQGFVETFGWRARRVKDWTTDFVEMGEALPRGTRVVFGHMNFGLHRAIPVRYATVLRDPVARYFSHFRLYWSQKARNGRATPDFEAFAAKKRYHNLQTAVLSGTYKDGRPPPDEVLPLALANADSLAVVGFFDRLDAFAAAVGIRSMGRVVEAVRLDGFTPSAAQIALAEAHNATDIALYRALRARFAS